MGRCVPPSNLPSLYRSNACGTFFVVLDIQNGKFNIFSHQEVFLVFDINPGHSFRSSHYQVVIL